MAAEYPSAIASFRTITNRPGVEYNSDDTKTLFAEDLKKIQDEIVAMQTLLTLKPGLVAYPVGAIYISVGSISPATLFGGIWSVFGVGRCLVGIDSGDTDFDAVEEVRGTKTQALTVANLPAHYHDIFVHNVGTAIYQATKNGIGDNGGAVTSYPTEENGGGTAHNNIQPSIVVRMWKRTA
jgi:hypothetical protein